MMSREGRDDADPGRTDGAAERGADRFESESAGEIKRKIEALRLVMSARPETRHDQGPAVPGSAIGDGSEGAVGTDAIEDSREIVSPYGKCLRIDKAVGDLHGMEHLTADSLTSALGRIACGPLGRTGVGTEFGTEIGAVVRAAGSQGKRVVFLDLETTGLSATPLFLAGTLLVGPDRLAAVQLLARDYSEERCLIGFLDGLLEECDVCITFNGKSFDLPYLRERAKYHRLGLRSSPEQFDLLHHARRRWKHALPDCRLLTLEWHILGRRRLGDVDGWIVPCIYHEFVHTRDARRLKQVLRHNLMDVLSMAELVISLSET